MKANKPDKELTMTDASAECLWTPLKVYREALLWLVTLLRGTYNNNGNLNFVKMPLQSVSKKNQKKISSLYCLDSENPVPVKSSPIWKYIFAIHKKKCGEIFSK